MYFLKSLHLLVDFGTEQVCDFTYCSQSSPKLRVEEEEGAKARPCIVPCNTSTLWFLTF